MTRIAVSGEMTSIQQLPLPFRLLHHAGNWGLWLVSLVAPSLFGTAAAIRSHSGMVSGTGDPEWALYWFAHGLFLGTAVTAFSGLLAFVLTTSLRRFVSGRGTGVTPIEEFVLLTPLLAIPIWYWVAAATLADACWCGRNTLSWLSQVVLQIVPYV